ncbi:Spy0128 family protein [Streptococcus salivarius]|uniref:YSIRK-type signal peptide-containing protein n=2 Tax=Bacillati TaxID=1783272 RepID=A0A6A8UG06_STRSL|nr:FctA domain-containing protein [Streptococcus salivarius]MTQ89525.1 YSIRK-type signal peptide-containing protein [Streptococcus salivarius]MTR27102.1 YSIRK-type signal peptide-containing protein [Streptococcus salivarius]MTR38353.1 YSIRK-type signal peptide-containing protein [Streptococcus salivarius]
MNNRFGDSRQRFSIRKFTVGIASILLSSAVFGVSTANAEQAEEPKGQLATSVLEEASESDGGGQRTSASVSSKEVTAEPTVQAESTSAISVTAISSEVVLQEQTVASSEQTSSSQDKTSEALSEKPVTGSETREASASELAAASNSSSTSSGNFGLKITNLSRPIPADVKVTKTGTEIHVQNPNVELQFPDGNSIYSRSKVVYHDISFPNDIAINSGDKVIFTLPSELQFKTSYSVNVYNPNNEVVGIAQVDPKNNSVVTTFNHYFEDHPIGKYMNLELDTLYSEALKGGEKLHLNFNGHVVNVTVGSANPIPSDEVIAKWGSQDKNDPTLINWGMRLNYARRVLNNLQLIDTWSDNQRFVDNSLELRYIDSAEPWVDKGSAMELIKSFSHDDTKFELNLGRLDRMVYVWYQTRLTNPASDSNNPTNKVDLHADVESKTYTSEVRLVGGRGNAGGEQEVHFNLELAKELAGRALKDKEFTFKLVDMTDNKMVDLGETTNDASGKIVFSNLVLNQPGTYHYRVTEVPGNDSDVVYDKLQADVTVQVARETTDGREKLVAKVVYPDDVIFNNKLVTPAKAKIAFGKELTKAGVKQDLKADQFQFVLKDRFGKVLETVGNTADGQVAFSELTFNKVGTYNYTVEELAGKDDAIVYDTMKAAVSITVTRDGDALVSTVVNPKDTIFNNKFVTPAKAAIQFSKELTKAGVNQTLTANEFQFVLKDSAGHIVETVGNTADGRVAFSELHFDKAGTYTYTVEEVKGTNEDIVYDGMKATVWITVTRDGDALVSTVANPKDTVFNNYVKEVQPAKAKFELTKVLTGRNLKDGEFSFVLKDDKGNVIQTVTNNAQGNISFENIVYDKPGVYYYTVEEVKGNEADVVYDNMVAKFQVTVTKTVGEKENLLVAAVLLPLDTEFNNSYIPPKPPTPPTPPTPPSVPPKPPVVPPTPPTPPTPPVTPKPAKPVQSSEKSGPQLPETGQANDTALLALGVAAEMAAVMGVAYSHRRRKDV